MTRVLLVSTYEQGHQPLGLASPAGALRAAGHDVRTLDLAVEPAAPGAFTDVDLAGISVPMHTAARLAVRLAERLRDHNPGLPIVLYGLYASQLDDHLRAPSADGTCLVDAVVGGEYEGPLVALADAVGEGASLSAPGVGAVSLSAPGVGAVSFSAPGVGAVSLSAPGVGATPIFPRDAAPLPDRTGLPSLDDYARATVLIGDGLLPDGSPADREVEERLAGYVEATRGCAHRCTHCPLTPTYAGRLRLVPPEIVLADIDAQVDLGARHISFGDPDFFNAVPHSLQLLRVLNRRHPGLTYDVTIKVEHLLEFEQETRALARSGVAWVTSAFESVDDALLHRLDKDHTRADMERALEITRASGLTLRPTWLTFTPWTSLADFAAILDFVATHDLVQSVPPVQYGLRLLLPPGSPLIAQARADGFLTGFDTDGLTYAWRNPDPAVDALQAKVAAFVARVACSHDGPTDNSAVFTRIRADAALAMGAPLPRPVSQSAGWVPGLSEDWFC